MLRRRAHRGIQPVYWPRAGSASLPVDVDEDRPCGNCGYNLRGISLRAPCPECGSSYGMNPDDEQVPWDERSGPLTFLATVALVLIHPAFFARQVWCPVRFDAKRAARFRRICVGIGWIYLSGVAFGLTRQFLGTGLSLAWMPIQSVAVLLGLAQATMAPVAALRDSGVGGANRRLQVLSHYLAAWTVLSPLHFLVLPLADRADMVRLAGVLLLHLLLLGLQLATVATAEARLRWETVDLPKGVAHASAWVGLLGRLMRLAFYVIVMPALLAIMAYRVHVQ